MSSTQLILRTLYREFNARHIDGILPSLAPSVVWPNGMEGGTLHGHRAVREYWTRQWAMINPQVEPVSFQTLDDGSVRVEVRQVVHDLDGQLLVDQIVFHTYRFQEGLVAEMAIEGSLILE